MFCLRNRETEALECEAVFLAFFPSPCTPSSTSDSHPGSLGGEKRAGAQPSQEDRGRESRIASCRVCPPRPPPTTFSVFGDNSVSAEPFPLPGIVCVWKPLHHQWLVVDSSWKKAPCVPRKESQECWDLASQPVHGRGQVPITEEGGG